MSKISTSIGHLKTFLLELEEHTTKLEAGQRSAAPKARGYAQKMRNLLGELRKDCQQAAHNIPTKSRTNKVQFSEPANEVINPVSIVASVMEDMPTPLILQRQQTKAK